MPKPAPGVGPMIAARGGIGTTNRRSSQGAQLPPTAYETIYNRIAGVTALPRYLQVQEGYQAGSVFVSPGRMVDVGAVTTILNAVCGLRFYRGTFGPRGWLTAAPHSLPQPFWCMPADALGFVPIWGGARSLEIVVEFYGPAVTSASLELSILPYEG